MNCSPKASFVIEGAKLRFCKDNHFNIKLKSQCFQIIKGTVYNQKQEPCEGAVVQVIQINCKDKTRCLLGYVLTGENGGYLFALNAKPHLKYELTIYAPLSM
jgi:hypothetical protein